MKAVNSEYIKTTESKSFETVVSALENLPFLQARVEFFTLIMSTQLEPFLQEFQGNSPRATFLYEQLQTTLSKLLNRFVKADVMETAKRGSDLSKLILKKSPILRRIMKLTLGLEPCDLFTLVLCKNNLKMFW